MNMGMSRDEFWYGDPFLVEDYRKLKQLSFEDKNFGFFLQGRYFYDALLCVAPILHAYAKKGTKATPYHKEPYDFSDSKKEEKAKPLNMKERFEIIAAQINKHLELSESSP